MKKMRSLWYRAFSLVAIFSFPLVSRAQWDKGKTLAGESGLPSQSLFAIIGNTMDYLLAILGFLSIIGFVVAGIMYLTAAGDEGQIDRAKEATKYSVIGVIVALIGFIVTLAVDSWLNGRVVF